MRILRVLHGSSLGSIRDFGFAQVHASPALVLGLVVRKRLLRSAKQWGALGQSPTSSAPLSRSFYWIPLILPFPDVFRWYITLSCLTRTLHLLHFVSGHSFVFLTDSCPKTLHRKHPAALTFIVLSFLDPDSTCLPCPSWHPVLNR